MPRTDYQGSGEAGIRNPLSKERYCQEVGIEVMDAVLKASCEYFGCQQPVGVVVQESNTRQWGKYKQDEKVIYLNRARFGVLVHELAHHITRELHPTIPWREHHGPAFYEVLQEMHDLWR
jgi:hypothetical protein